MREFLKMVTVTGADDRTNFNDMYEIEKEFPFVEWGILLSKSSEGCSRFPTTEWITAFLQNDLKKKSGHLCGKWVRDIIDGDDTFWRERPLIAHMFQRIQLNFHAESHKADSYVNFIELIKKKGLQEFIFQLDGVNDNLCSFLGKPDFNCKISPFFDRSGGIGELPTEWPCIAGWHGMAGGLSPDNVDEQLKLISRKVRGPIWIDAETRLRTNEILDMDKVHEFLKKCQPMVLNEEE